jgi:hypothetical protein
MIAYRFNPNYAIHAVAQIPQQQPRRRVSLGPYTLRSNARHALRDYAEKVDRPRTDFVIITLDDGRFRIVERSEP